MRLAIVLTILLLNGYTTGLAATDETNFPFPPEVQACIDHPPSASNDPDGALRCIDIIEAAALDRWKAMYVARHPTAKVCRDNPPLPSDHSLTSLCFTLIDEEDTAVAHHKDKLHVSMDQLRTRVIERAAKKAARPVCDAACQRLNAMSVEELDAEIAGVERGMDMMFLPPMPLMREPVNCISSQMGSYTYTNCY